MRRTLVALIVVPFVLSFAARGGTAHSAANPVYTARQVQAGLLQTPGRWLGRTVLVRGRIAVQGVLYAPGATLARYALGEPDGLPRIAWSRQVISADLFAPTAPDTREPLLVDQLRGAGDLVVPNGRRERTYRVALTDASPLPGCSARLCYRAVLLDPA